MIMYRIPEVDRFLLLAAGFVGVSYYNIRKMAIGEPRLSIAVKDNTFKPPIFFCTLSSYIEAYTFLLTTTNLMLLI